jgi:hypothetical protein
MFLITGGLGKIGTILRSNLEELIDADPTSLGYMGEFTPAEV